MSTLSADIGEARRLLSTSSRIAVLSGAGLSVESGIDTFRGPAASGAGGGGLWARYPPEQFAVLDGLVGLLAREPATLARFLVDVLEPIARAAPNAGHHALAALAARVEQRLGVVDVITQNVDGLHQEAGSTRVHEVHGSFFQIVDSDGRPLRTLSRADLVRIVARLDASTRGLLKRLRMVRALNPLLGLPRLHNGHMALAHRPSVVLFGEGLREPDWSRAELATENCELFIVVGTSGTVEPAASLPQRAKDAGARVIGIGPDPKDAPDAVDLWLTGSASTVLQTLMSVDAQPPSPTESQ